MRTEKILGFVVLLGLVAKTMHWGFGSQVLILSLCTLGGLYFPLGFYFLSDKNLKTQVIALSIISGIFLSTIPTGILFKVQYWPGAQQRLIIGVIFMPVIIGITSYLRLKGREELKTYYKNLLTRTTVWFLLACLFYFTPTSTLLNIQYQDDPELARILTLHYTHPENKEYKQLYDNYIQKRDWKILLALSPAKKPVGFIIGSISHGPELVRGTIGKFEDWFVEEKWRGHGAGGKLYRQLEEWFKEKGCQQVISDTWDGNMLSIDAHLKLGFFVSGISFSKKLR